MAVNIATMLLPQLIVFFAFFFFVDGRNNVKSLTESLGQEVIEIGAPIKESVLPPGVEEEPSAENYEDVSTKAAVEPTTRRELKRVMTTTKKDVEVEDTASQEEEEAKIEQELAEIYKDTDYKSDSTEGAQKLKLNATLVDSEKPVARQRASFKFQPDLNNKADIERFRTSIDEISCDNRVTQRLPSQNSNSTSASARESLMSFIQITIVLVSLIVCH